MKHKINRYLHSIMLSCCLVTPIFALSACAAEIERPEVKEPLMPEEDEPLVPDSGPEATKGTISLSQIETSVAFTGGTGANSFRIPSMITAADGALLVFCEARHESWKDKSYTDVVVKRSTDNGRTWSELINLTGSINEGKGYAFMDPTPVVDKSTGKIFLFCCRWLKLNTDTSNNRAFMIVSSDNGKTWTSPEDVTGKVLANGHFCAGFGPGAGIQIANGPHFGRLILSSRQFNGTVSKGYVVYSDDHGATWKIGSEVLAGESQIAECGGNRLTMNIRRSSDRYSAFSNDGGQSWTTASKDSGLPSVAGGCQASVLHIGGNMVLYCGPKGGVRTANNDNRSDLILYRSPTGAEGWTRSKILYELAAGYSDMTLLDDGRLAIVFEAGPEKGFTLVRDEQRPEGWMRLDVLVLPKEVTDYGYWFE